MPAPLDLLCIGSLHWDILGRSAGAMAPGADMPGLIVRQPGGVALNVAMAAARFGLRPALLGAVGTDADGHDLLAHCQQRAVVTDYVHRSPDRPTDRYLAIEDAGGLVAAIADTRALDTAREMILRPLLHGPLGSGDAPHAGRIVLDGNLESALLSGIAAHPAFAAADLRIASASTAKAGRLAALLGHPRATLYLNRDEASAICGTPFSTATAAARALVNRGARRCIVTDGRRSCADADADATLTARPPDVPASRVTGAGDTFMAAHIAAEATGAARPAALDRALAAAAAHVAGAAA